MENRQLRMRLKSLDKLPELNLPNGYELSTFVPELEKGYEEIIGKSFGGEHNFQEEVVSKGDRYNPKWTFFICHDGKAVATSTALIDKKDPERCGYLHMVGALSEHKGKKLGYLVSLACLKVMKKEGMVQCILDTDDFRLPAIVTYLKLGFLPEIVQVNQYERWSKVLKEIGCQELIDYVMELEVK